MGLIKMVHKKLKMLKTYNVTEEVAKGIFEVHKKQGFITFSDIDGNRISLNLKDYSSIEFQKEEGKSKRLPRSLRVPQRPPNVT